MIRPLSRLGGNSGALALVGLLGVACGSEPGTLLGPTAPPPAAPATRPATGWLLSETLTSLTANGIACGFTALRVGERSTPALLVSRDATEIELAYGHPADGYELSGTVDGTAFTGTRSWRSVSRCPGAASEDEYTYEWRVTGRFSEDGDALTATSVWTFRFASGGEAVVSYDWEATRIR